MQNKAKNRVGELPETIRVSIGSAMTLGLLEGKLDVAPTTAYLMTHREGKCVANCSFCPQARSSESKPEMLSRISWPAFKTAQVLDRLEPAVLNNRIRRVCVQALNYPQVIIDLCSLVKGVKQKVPVPISVSCQPQNHQDILALAQAGVDRLGIALDASTETLFEETKGKKAQGPYNWSTQFKRLREAVFIFGLGNVSTHLIVGLGETEKEMVSMIQNCVDLHILPSIFAFTPIKGTRLQNSPQPSILTYRRIQLARYLITKNLTKSVKMRFDDEGRIMDFSMKKQVLRQIVETGLPFLTSGCPDCNRPFYNEKLSGPIYNYPKNLTSSETAYIEFQLNL